MLVGADGAWSEVRRHILTMRGEKTAMQRWIPGFMGASGFYGISKINAENVDPEILWDTHGVWLDQGNLTTSPLPDGKIRWDLILPELEAPHYSAVSISEIEDVSSNRGSDWEQRIALGAFPHDEIVAILRSYAGIYHSHWHLWANVGEFREDHSKSVKTECLGAKRNTMWKRCSHW